MIFFECLQQLSIMVDWDLWLSSGKVREGLASFEATKKITFVRTTFFKSGWSEVGLLIAWRPRQYIGQVMTLMFWKFRRKEILSQNIIAGSQY
jgi:hypothetical protein